MIRQNLTPNMLPYRKSHGTISNFRSRIASQALIAGLFPYARLRKLQMRSPRIYPSAATVQSGADTEPGSSGPNYLVLRIACWCVALGLGATDAWANRFTMNPDGVSYLDIGDAYWHGDWHNAINAYWSPLYSWILGFFLKVVKPSAYWEYPLAHLVNFLIYVAALACFEFFLKTFIEDRRRRDQELLKDGQMGLPESSWWLLGYSLFASCSLRLIGLGLVTPDMCVAGFLFLASALLIRIRSGNATRATYLAFGLVLGFSYLAKAVMFPLGFVFLAVAIVGNYSSRSARSNAIFSLAAFLGIAGAFILLLSRAEGRVTFGDAGALTYEVYVDHVDQFVPSGAGLIHPIRKLLSEPATYEFSQPVSGTYPLWYNSAFWHAGLKPFFSLRGEWAMIRYGFLVYFVILTSVHQALAAALLALICISPGPLASCRAISKAWHLLVPSVSALILYWLVYTETRYVAPFVLIIWISLFSGLRYGHTERSRRLLSICIVAIAATTLIFQGVAAGYAIKLGSKADPTYWRAAQALSGMGLRPGDKLAVIASEPFGSGGAFVARLARMKIVAQTSVEDKSLTGNPDAMSRLLAALRDAHVQAVVWHAESRPESDPSWMQLDSTDYYVHVIETRDRANQP